MQQKQETGIHRMAYVIHAWQRKVNTPNSKLENKWRKGASRVEISFSFSWTKWCLPSFIWGVKIYISNVLANSYIIFLLAFFAFSFKLGFSSQLDFTANNFSKELRGHSFCQTAVSWPLRDEQEKRGEVQDGRDDSNERQRGTKTGKYKDRQTDRLTDWKAGQQTDRGT